MITKNEMCVTDDDLEFDGEEAEILPPARMLTTCSVMPPPNLGDVFADFRSKIDEVLSIPAANWPDDRTVSLHVDMTIVPAGVTVTISKK